MTIRFQCPGCREWTRTSKVSAFDWTCAACGLNVEALAPRESSFLKDCRVCGNHEMYVQKGFPHWLGMAVIAAASVAFVIAMGRYWIVTAWAILIGSAILDVILYLSMGNMTVCYRCLTEYRGFPPNPEHAAFNLAIGERYRQERLRRRNLKEP